MSTIEWEHPGEKSGDIWNNRGSVGIEEEG